MNRLLSPQDLAEWLGVPVGTVYRWRSQSPPYGPRGVRVGKHVRYDPDEVTRWLDQQAEQEVANDDAA